MKRARRTEVTLHLGQACGCAARTRSREACERYASMEGAAANIPEGCGVQVVCLGGSLRVGSLGHVPRANATAIPVWGTLASVGKLHRVKARLARNIRRQISLVPRHSSIYINQRPLSPSFLQIDLQP